MSFHLNKVVPWGRTYDEYVAMFALSETDLSGKILGCGDGPASFNSTLTKAGGKVISIDPLYQFSADEIKQRIQETYLEVMEQTRQNQDEFVWNHISSVEELGQVRMSAMQTFLADYSVGKEEGRYLAMSLPKLSFEFGQFDLALCSHFLFLYSQQLSTEFHLNSIKEMSKVANEVRIFPLLELGSIKSRHLTQVSSQLQKKGYQVDMVKVDYEFQKGGNQMMKVCR